MHPNEQLITTFYQCFHNRDVHGMARCYHPDIHFHDPAFQDLHGRQVTAMWEMLTGRSKDLVVNFSKVKADDQTGSAHWDADYTYSATGRMVHNSVDASFKFKDGLIIDHRDSFNLWRWSSQALGVSGMLLGWSPIVQNKVHQGAKSALEAYIAKRKTGV